MKKLLPEEVRVLFPQEDATDVSDDKENNDELCDGGCGEDLN